MDHQPSINQPKRYITWEELISLTKQLADKLPKELPLIYGIPRNGTIISGLLAHQNTTFKITDAGVANVIVDDIHDTGDTLNAYKGYNFKIASIFWRRKEDWNRPDYFVETIYDNTWIVFPWEKD